MLIREEHIGDHDTIATLLTRAFGQSQEADLIGSLRADGDLLLSLVAENNHEIVGYIGFSKMKSPLNAVSLAPVAVLPDHQNKGIGSELIRIGLEQAKNLEARAVFVLGEPGFYRRFGFSVKAAQAFKCVYAGPYLMVKFFEKQIPGETSAVYADAFLALDS